MNGTIEAQFDNAMMDIYRNALKEAKYDAKRFLQMLLEHHGIETARRLLYSNHVSEGYTALYERQRLDLTVEALILKPEWNELFTDEDREIARKRLKEYGYF